MLKIKIIQYSLSIFCSMSLLLLSGCQSQPSALGSTSRSKEAPLKVKRLQDGIQNIHWSMTEINGEKVKMFAQTPFIQLDANVQLLNGHTGCNPLFGKYDLNTQSMRLKFDVRSGHQSCDNALAQEANLLDALGHAQRYQLVGNRMHVFDARGQLILMLQK